MAPHRRPLTVEERERLALDLDAVLSAQLPESLRLPNLVGVGTARAATTFLHGLLRGQTNVYVTPVKETNYFGIGSRRRMTLREYRLLFMGQDEQPYVAEVTPTYLHQPGSMEEMAEALEAPKVIINLREPVERLISHYKFDKAKHGCADLETFLAVALEQGLRVKAWTAPGRSILLSLYAEAIERAFDLFGRENCCLLAYDEADPDGRRWIAQLSRFLGVDLQPLVPDSRYTNATARQPLALPDTPAAGEVLAMFEEDARPLRGLIGPELPDRWAAARRS